MSQGKGNILLIDDDDSVLVILSRLLDEMGFHVEIASTGEEGIAKLSEIEEVDLIFLDQQLPGMSGLETLSEITKNQNAAQVIMITAHADIADAVSSIKLGAFDYLVKPVDREQLELAASRAKKVMDLNRENNRLKEELQKVNISDKIITHNKAMLEMLNMAKSVADVGSTVMIYGESGTGKELVAKTIHQMSPRKDLPFVPVNCAALTEELLGSALFGFEKGAFTGAYKTTPGCFETANGATLFLDEIADMSPKLQSSLLRVIQEKEFCRIGSYKPIKTDFRLITATNKVLDDEVKADRFREDLYYRLKVVTIQLPPLRERIDDIPLLVRHFLDKVNKQTGRKVEQCSIEAMEKLKTYSWRGNCRELENVLESIVAVKHDGTIEEKDLPDNIRATDKTLIDINSESKLIRSFAIEKSAFEKQYLAKALVESDSNITKMSKLTGIPRPNLYRKLKKFSLK